MGATDTEQLEGIISSVVNKEFPIAPPTEAEFDNIANRIRGAMEAVFHVSDDAFIAIKRRLKSKVIVQMDLGRVIKGASSLRQSWLPNRRADIDFFFWKRYKAYLEEIKGWNPRMAASLDRVSDEIIDLLGDPKSASPFQARGLIIGDVQSGKTANYTAICNKAADVGYNAVIILSGIQENLRQQTQERLDSEFSGRRSDYLLDPRREIENVPIGVGKYGQDKKIDSFTSVAKDFDKNIIKQLSLQLRNGATSLFVVKKNKSILNNLIHWLKDNNADKLGQINMSLLLIDDEADNASVNTNDRDRDPTAINSAVRNLLRLFSQSSYLGVTATPYANIFIDPDSAQGMLGDDLFPRDFVYLLSPPSSYIGPEGIFGGEESSKALYKDSLIPLYPQEINLYFPFGHKKDHNVDDIPASLEEAIAYFLLVNAIRDLRGDNRTHRTMMIHVSRFVDVQNQLRDLAASWVFQVRSDIQNYACLSEEESSQIKSIAFLKGVWEKHGLIKKASSDPSPISWHEFLSKYLHKAVSPVEIRAVNELSGAASLDYHSHIEGGLRVIAIGGNSLSRGLTLEGLIVSYFYRSSVMYDTLLQMGRWFGYRDNYSDLFKIWISTDAIDWYGYINEAESEFKQEIARMNYIGLTPMDYGLKVRQDPGSLIVTAKNKMRSAEYVKRPITVSGRLIETPRLIADESILRSNEEVIKSFVKKLPIIGKRIAREDAKFFWSGIDKGEIEQLLRDFKTHPWQLNFQGQALADFIRDDESMGKWDVFIPQGNAEGYKLELGEGFINTKPEIRYIRATGSQISISGTMIRVGSVGAMRVGLTDEEKRECELRFRSEKPQAKAVPDREYLKIKRKPLLALHIICPDKTGKEPNGAFHSQIDEGVYVPGHIFALGLGIPENGKEKVANYMVNLAEARTYNDLEGEDI